tara:strand:+ start:117 stop:710 length:594 start_codon:yes stop_codon:yes gene_type:complete
MFKQSVNIVEFGALYNILYEIKTLFKFNIYNHKNLNDFNNETQLKKINITNSVIIVNNKNHSLFSNKEMNNNILIFDGIPTKIGEFIDKINTQLIKQKYNLQSKLDIKNYVLNLNSRIISCKDKILKLTEKEIDIILFLNENKIPQSVHNLQNEVWGYVADLETHTVETHIYRLRKKIKDKFSDQNFIISHDEGYLI